MTEVPPDLAAKVEAASLRNLVKEVSEGAVLSPSNKQLIMAFSTMGDPEAIRKARETALLAKFLTAGRLSKEEREEIAHIIGHPAEPGVEKTPPPVVAAPAAAPAPVTRGADDYEHIKIGRRTYFRWLKFGKQLPEGPDLPPFDEPHLLPAWYERMRQRGIFKHRFPDEIADAIAAHTSGEKAVTKPGKEPTSSAPGTVAPGTPAAPTQHVPASFGADHGLASGLQYEVIAEQQRVAALRVARDEAYLNNKKDDGDAYDRRYREALDALSLVQQRAIKIGEQEARLVPVEIIEQEFAPRLNAIVQGGLLLWDSVGPALMECPDHATRRMLWKKKWIEFCTGLRTDRFRFAPPLELSS